MNILVACEESQVVTIAFRRRGHRAYSCDTQPCSGGHPEWHIQGDALEILGDGWDLMIAHPPCTYLSYVGMRHWNKPGRAELREKAMLFFMEFINAPIDKICVENPRGYPSKVFRPPDQTIHPYYFGDGFLKRTCFWLKNLPTLTYRIQDDMFGKRTAADKPLPLYISQGEVTKGKKIHWTEGVKSKKSKTRSVTFQGLADAMAEQWGGIILTKYPLEIVGDALWDYARR